MDKDTVVFDSTVSDSGSTFKWMFRILAVLAVVASTALSVIFLQPPEPAVNFDEITKTEDIKEDTVYRFDELKVSGIFMYMADSTHTGTPRNNGAGVFMEKEYIHAYHTMALANAKDGSVCVMVFSAGKNDGKIFDMIAEHDAKENEASDPGSSFPVSVYARAKKLGSAATEAFKKSMEEHKNAPGIDTVKWVFCEMEYYLDGDESYEAFATTEKRENLKLSLGLLPVAALFFIISLIPHKKSAKQYTEDINVDNNDGFITQ